MGIVLASSFLFSLYGAETRGKAQTPMATPQYVPFDNTGASQSEVAAGASPGYDFAVQRQGYTFPPPPVVMQQPVAGVTTVIHMQPQSMVMPPRIWTSGLCSCADDIKICLCGAFCSLCLLTKVSVDMDESLCVPCCVCNALLALRVKMRTQENIQGSILGDQNVTCCCGPCALCQLAREAEFVKKRDQNVI